MSVALWIAWMATTGGGAVRQSPVKLAVLCMHIVFNESCITTSYGDIAEVA